jgi:hypothetical protein
MRSIIVLAFLITVGAAERHGVEGQKPTPSREDVREGERQAKPVCAGCHAFPAPSILPRAAWRTEVEKMALFMEGKMMGGWGPQHPEVVLNDRMKKVLAYYEARAPEALPPLERWPAPDARARFMRRPIRFKGALTAEPAAANVHLTDLDGDGRLEVLAADMRQGSILLAAPYDTGLGALAIAAIPHPAHITTSDLDRDGRTDLLVADLGEFLPGDHDKGAAVWLRSVPEGGYVPFALRGFPRVADVAAADFDRDGALDLVVAAFGWRKTGGIDLLLNKTADWKVPSFKRATVDARPGAIHVVPADLNRDGNMDIVALIAQQHESVVALIGDGEGAFTARTLYAAPHPNWGSTGMQLVDFDRDGDSDILVTNGDMFDDDILKPYHGIQWLENKGKLKFEPRTVAQLAGVHRAVAADLDGDRDLDLVAAAFAGAANIADAALPSLVWLERTGRNSFEKHTIETGNATHATLEAGDVDKDGDVDIVTGTFLLRGTSETWLEVWENGTLPLARMAEAAAR